MFLRPISTLALLLGFSLPLQAAFQYPATSARSSAMGNAFMAFSDESSAVFLNPAGLAQLTSGEVSFLYGKPLAGLPDVDMGFGQVTLALPTRLGHVGLGYTVFQAQDLLREQTLAASYGLSLFDKRVSLGGTVKHLHHAYLVGSDPSAQNDAIFRNGTSKGAVAFDAGLIVAVSKPLKLGAAVRNINQPDVGLVAEDKVLREVQAGVLLDITGLGLKASGDLFMKANDPNGVKNDPIPRFGLEKSFHKNMFALRLGANTEEYTGGFGLTLGRLGFDYALVMNKNLMEDSVGSHKLGMTYRFTPSSDKPANKKISKKSQKSYKKKKR